ncbi:NYN domain-containing protein [Actinomycetospora lutea]|uniref:NYN domain-containing protein n=1 Tax=Actinomycetospora lutea TaxID=663604 RepID=UPI00236629DF|nr:NYN domain-containing protein [Actinomycetospora lutea]MDD7938268.1 NYN domain-containing protein [Actinomycetospora lutea]
MAPEDERIALFLDYENLAIGARDGLGVSPFDFGPVADALAERGRVVTRRAYGDWSAFDEDRRLLARAQVELIEIPQRIGGSRKNAADIKMAVDAIELAYERGFVTTFAIGTGDSDFTPLMHKLREMDKRVIGIGVQSSTSKLLPAACDEFLFYDRLPGVEGRPVPARPSRRRPTSPAAAPEPVAPAEPAAPVAPVEPDPAPDDTDTAGGPDPDLATVVTSTLAGLARATDGPVRASTLKRAILRKDPTFDEGDQGFRGFGELLRHLESRGVLALAPGTAAGDPEVAFPEDTSAEDEAFALFATTVRDLEEAAGGPPQLSGLKDQMRKRDPGFSEKRYGFNGFLSFARAARARDLVTMEWDEGRGDYQLSVF